MKKTLILLLIVLPAFIAGCAVTVGNQTVGIQSGRFFFHRRHPENQLPRPLRGRLDSLRAGPPEHGREGNHGRKEDLQGHDLGHHCGRQGGHLRRIRRITT